MLCFKTVLILAILNTFFEESYSIYVVEPGPKYPPTEGEVWPKPRSVIQSNAYFKFQPKNLSVRVRDNYCHVLKEAIKIYGDMWERQDLEVAKRNEKLKLPVPSRDKFYTGMLDRLVIRLEGPCEDYPYLDMDETYQLTVDFNSSIVSKSVWGIIRGLETWTQLLYFSSNLEEVRIHLTEVTDYPSYKHRGLLIDTGRHYLSLDSIRTTLDAMAMNKMNVLHWHMVDDQSFPFKSERLPMLSEKGAFHPSLVYTKDDIKMIIEYARVRAIRVIPEIDVPGHTRSWGTAYPEILTKCYKLKKLLSLGPMNPTMEKTYKIVGELLSEVQDIFPDKYFHIGGDEADASCWSSNPDLVKYIHKNKKSVKDLQTMFMKKAIALLKNTTVPMIWQEVFDENIPLSKDTLIQVWKFKWIDEMVKILKSGHKLVYSASWYLDYVKFDWDSFYLDDPRLMVYKVDSSLPLKNIVGGEACMWGERVDDANVISRTWPRASAVAERLWSGLDYKNPPKTIVTNHVRRRIEEHTCRMSRRGVATVPPNGSGFCLKL